MASRHLWYDVLFGCVLLQQSSFMADSSMMEQLQHQEGMYVQDVQASLLCEILWLLKFCAINKPLVVYFALKVLLLV